MEIKFNDGQLAAINTTHPYNRVVAGAGTGKTQVISARVKHLLEDIGAKPEEIFLSTFSKNGASEMAARVNKMVGKPVCGLTATTFHAFEFEIIKKMWHTLGYRHIPSVIDEVQDRAMCDALIRRHEIVEWTGVHFQNYTSSGYGTTGALDIMSMILHRVSRLVVEGRALSDIVYNDVAELLTDRKVDLPSNIALKIIAMYPEYDSMKKGFDNEFQAPVITFDEMIVLALKILDDNPTFLDDNFYFAHIIVDEAQDTSEDQMKLLNHLINMKSFKSLLVVGDDSQAIYESLMNTSPDFLINLGDYLYKKDEDGNKLTLDIHDVFMDINYRCIENVIKLANIIIDRNKNKIDKTLIASREPGMMPTVQKFKRKYDQKPSKLNMGKNLEKGEIDTIARDIKTLIDAGEDPDNIAFLAFSKGELKSVADRLTAFGIPSKFGFPELLIENHRVIAMLKFIREISKPDAADANMDMLEVANALFDGDIIEAGPEIMSTYVNEVVNKVNTIKAVDPAAKKLMIMEFIQEISHGDEAVLNFSEKFNDMDADEIMYYVSNFLSFGDNMMFKRSVLGHGVMLITVHSSKGLEWKHVFGSVSGFEKEKLSTRKAEELRRLLFVMITRARDSLSLYGQEIAFGTIENPTYNRFLQEIEDALAQL